MRHRWLFGEQVRSASVSRVSADLLVRWPLHQENGKALQVYFHLSLAVIAMLGLLLPVSSCSWFREDETVPLDSRDPICYCLDGASVERVVVARGPSGLDVGVTLRGEAAQRFNDLTAENRGRRMLVVANGEVLLDTRILAAVNSGGMVFGGIENAGEAHRIADLARNAVPVSSVCAEACIAWEKNSPGDRSAPQVGPDGETASSRGKGNR